MEEQFLLFCVCLYQPYRMCEVWLDVTQQDFPNGVHLVWNPVILLEQVFEKKK